MNQWFLLWEKMAEGKGFEPPEGVSSFNDLANRRLQPLGHPSAGATKKASQLPTFNDKCFTAYAAFVVAANCLAVKSQNAQFHSILPSCTFACIKCRLVSEKGG